LEPGLYLEWLYSQPGGESRALYNKEKILSNVCVHTHMHTIEILLYTPYTLIYRYIYGQGMEEVVVVVTVSVIVAVEATVNFN